MPNLNSYEYKDPADFGDNYPALKDGSCKQGGAGTTDSAVDVKSLSNLSEWTVTASMRESRKRHLIKYDAGIVIQEVIPNIKGYYTESVIEGGTIKAYHYPYYSFFINEKENFIALHRGNGKIKIEGFWTLIAPLKFYIETKRIF